MKLYTQKHIAVETTRDADGDITIRIESPAPFYIGLFLNAEQAAMLAKQLASKKLGKREPIVIWSDKE